MYHESLILNFSDHKSRVPSQTRDKTFTSFSLGEGNRIEIKPLLVELEYILAPG